MIKADYYDKFKCKCGECRSVCCGGWGITVSDEEYFRLIGLDCPAELRYILDCALAVVDDPCPERYAMMKPSYTGKCRLINEAGLCSLQIACGEEVLPAVCRMYPRSLTEKHAGCSASCERVTEMLMRDTPLSFSSPLPEPMETYVKALQDSLSPQSGQLPRRGSHSKASLFEGGGAAERRDGRSLKPLKERIADLLPDVFPHGYTYFYFGLLSMYTAIMAEASERFAETVYKDFYAYGKDKDGEERLYKDIAEFDNRFPDAEKWFENLIINRMLITDFPGDDIKTALCGIVCEYALVRVASATCGTEEQFVDKIAALYRYIGHTNFNKNSRAAIERAGAFSVESLSGLLET